jgi:hypothetical protein
MSIGQMILNLSRAESGDPVLAAHTRAASRQVQMDIEFFLATRHPRAIFLRAIERGNLGVGGHGARGWAS